MKFLSRLVPLILGMFLIVSCETPTTESTVYVESVTLSSHNLSLSVGGLTASLTATIAPSNAANKDIIWSSNNTNVATVKDGIVTPVGGGSAMITVTSVDQEKSDSCLVQVMGTSIAVESVSVSPTTMTLVSNGPIGTITPTFTPSLATNRAITWTSSDTNVATVSDGLVTPLSVGTVTITAITVDGGKKATCEVTVTATAIAVTGVTLNQSTMNLVVGGATGTLTASVLPSNALNKNVLWNSSDTDVATVENGVVTPLGAGSATITVTTVEGLKTASCEVTVTNANLSVTGVSLDVTTMTLMVGGVKGTLMATIEPYDATNWDMSWSSSDTSIVTVSEGLLSVTADVNPVSTGTATITVTTADGGKTATCQVTVVEGVSMVSIPGGGFYNGTAEMAVSSFKMSSRLITQAQFLAVAGENDSYFQEGSDGPNNSGIVIGDLSRPVEQVSWYDAVEFCNKLSIQSGLEPVYTISNRYPSSHYPILSATVTQDRSKNGYRLPTEAEWMWAAMGGSSDAIASNIVNGINRGGYEKIFAGDDQNTAINDAVWHFDNSEYRTHPVGTKLPNELGLYDMTGNVNQWCWDFYGSYPASAKTDYTGPTTGVSRVYRGGCWLNTYSLNNTIGDRKYHEANYTVNIVGFRVVAP